MNANSQPESPDFKGIGYSKIGYFKEARSKIKELELLNVELTLRNNQLEAVFNSISDGLTILDRDLNIVFVNQVQKDFFSEAPLTDRKCFDVFFKKSHPCKHCPVIRTMQHQENLSGEISVPGPDNLSQYYEWTTSPVRDSSGRVHEILLLMRNITERKEYEYKLMQADRMSAIGFLAAGIAHEINNPLTSIAGFSEALMKRIKNAQSVMDHRKMQAFEEYLGIINAEAYRCKDIIYNLQDFSRNSLDDFEVLSIDAILRAALSLFHQRAIDHNIRIDYDASFNPGADAVHGKKSQLKHLFLNLLIRAFNTLEDGGNFSIRALNDGKQLKIIMTGVCSKGNQGCANGFPVLRSEVDLSICYNIVQHHSGVMQFEMSQDMGGVLAIYFPFAGGSDS